MDYISHHLPVGTTDFYISLEGYFKECIFSYIKYFLIPSMLLIYLTDNLVNQGSILIFLLLIQYPIRLYALRERYKECQIKDDIALQEYQRELELKKLKEKEEHQVYHYSF